ncbi:3'-5' exoribonuclease YhaM family protein [Frisingicoccus sp.]|uniref:3'-5' exoribonuclease YhaM family protein n=1 Tax=Frisingicoccus sp. TaxID=1918627 RepID=UPI00261367D9|nr:HD domain-containing protein [Frisingicoccus sp.]MDD6232227.1 HD domain-containing protein [Frisingicoccus sp.]MDY4922740.1 HD domain-containing protein [Frisingicoccus sp.]
MRFIADLREGDHISGIYLCKNKQNLKTKAGKSYYSMLLQDKTGTLDAKVWDLNNGIEHFESLDFIKVDGLITSFQGALQVNVRRVRRTQEQEYDIRDYLPTSRFDIEEMMKELVEIIQTIKNPYLKTLLDSFFVKDKEFIKSFKAHSAAKSVHHGFVGGLLEHTLSVTKLCDFYCKRYPILNRDLLLTAAMCHDIGKTTELSLFPENDYTDEGQLIGHIVKGTEMIHDRIRDIPNFPQVLANELKHCILAHHGELEYGSPKKPALVEALALNLADNTDAKMETMTEFFAGAMDGSEWLGYNRLFESNIRRTSK